MNREYRLWEVPVKGWTSASLPKGCSEQLNKLARAGWKVDHITSLQVGLAGTTTVVFLLVRES
jgi:hypothetical protein